MYYVVFGILYLFSLLPFRILYGLSNLAGFILYRVMRYRVQVVMENLRNSFPEKTGSELEVICRDFYRNFCDNWIEMVKMLSVSKKTLSKRISFDFSLLEQLYKTGKPVHLFAGHFMNWELTTTSVPRNQPYPLLAIYLPVGSAVFNRLIQHIRTRFGTILLRTGHVKKDMLPWEKQPYAMGFIADQSPSNTMQAYWMHFMTQPAGFIRKPWVLTLRQQLPAVYLKVTRLRRGYYFFEVVPVSTDRSNVSAADLAKTYRDLLESDIKRDPANYLWTHRRWKREWRPEYASLWVENLPVPSIQAS